MSRILVPINFSVSSIHALRYAHHLSRHLDMCLSLLHCYPVQAFSRPYDFGKKSYDLGIREKLMDFYKKELGNPGKEVRFLALSGSVVEKVASISNAYKMVILSSNALSSKLHRWVGSRTSYIASTAKCPVLIIPTAIEYVAWLKIWHVNRKQDETAIIEEHLAGLKINPISVEAKSFSQTTFKSALWRSVVEYVKKPKEEIRQAILETKRLETIDLIILVSHNKDSFQKFVNDDAIQIIFQFNIPILIFQAAYQ